MIDDVAYFLTWNNPMSSMSFKKLDEKLVYILGVLEYHL